MLNGLADGFAVALTPENLLFCFAGVLLGTIIGMLPGLGSASGVAILLPLTLGLEPVSALILLAGLYYGCEYGATISSVLIATPGEGASLVTVFDGNPMAKAGRAGQALAIAAVGSFVAGTASVVMLSVAAPLFASVALNFGPPEMFVLMVVGLLAVGGLSPGGRLKGWAMVALGGILSVVGIDTQTGDQRFTFGEVSLFSGVSIVAIVIGFIALTEVLHAASRVHGEPIRTTFREMVLRRADLLKARGAIVRGGLLGFLIGLLPGAGPTMATFVVYDVERRVAKDSSQFGKGDIRGVAAPESANNAAVNGAFVPTLTLGIPGSATTAVLLGAFILFDVQPGPLLFDEQPTLVWGLIASFYLGNVMLLILNLPLAPVFASVLRFRYALIYPVVLGIALIGVYAANLRLFDVWLTLGVAVLGYFLKSHAYAVAPIVLGLILGELIEGELRRSLAMSSGSPWIFFERPVSLGLLVGSIALIMLVWAVGRRSRRRLEAAAHAMSSDEPSESTHRGRR